MRAGVAADIAFIFFPLIAKRLGEFAVECGMTGAEVGGVDCFNAIIDADAVFAFGAGVDGAIDEEGGDGDIVILSGGGLDLVHCRDPSGVLDGKFIVIVIIPAPGFRGGGVPKRRGGGRAADFIAGISRGGGGGSGGGGFRDEYSAAGHALVAAFAQGGCAADIGGCESVAHAADFTPPAQKLSNSERG